ncbi:hypothetical protein F1737_04575 [Methanoplanus sp. FWC-SCC4]|uniref:MscL family protein n=1 Tax=Methanochimaera problematica TaxID=2609417 RepID=A0AA97FBR3_9EURY|nr:hypothetical protein [Methanoplanus sp. FWC-SCC4]WOF16029.1 hypothetical protein F1737_04575 [Methanoplanus sp. FWC-SCC4]
MKRNDYAIFDMEILLPAAIGLVVGFIVGDIIQTVITQALFPEIADALVNACPVEGQWKETQESTIGIVRIAIDMLFGVGGAVSIIGFMAIFQR